MRRICLTAFVAVLYFVPEFSAQADTIYYCTRLSKGKTQTYIAATVDGVPRCNNPKHRGPFEFTNVGGLTAGPQGPAGADGKDAPVGATVTGVLRSCHLEGESGVYNNFLRAGHCYLEGTSFTFRHVFGQASQSAAAGANAASVNDDAPFTLFHVPAGTYDLKCDIETVNSYCGYEYGAATKAAVVYPGCISYLQTSASVTVSEAGTKDVGTMSLCDADGDGFTTAQDCNDTNGGINPLSYDYCNDTDDDCDGQIDEDQVCDG